MYHPFAPAVPAVTDKATAVGRGVVLEIKGHVPAGNARVVRAMTQDRCGLTVRPAVRGRSATGDSGSAIRAAEVNGDGAGVPAVVIGSPAGHANYPSWRGGINFDRTGMAVEPVKAPLLLALSVAWHEMLCVPSPETVNEPLAVGVPIPARVPTGSGFPAIGAADGGDVAVASGRIVRRNRS